LTLENEVILGDFGLAMKDSPDEPAKFQGFDRSISGYTSPEASMSLPGSLFALDIWSVGIIFLELVSFSY
jgi:serine/threonine protein kinase